MIIAIEKLIELSREKLIKDVKLDSTDFDPNSHFQRVIHEAEEIKKEFKKDNAIFLEETLADAFFKYILFLSIMEKSGYIRSMDNVFERAYEKQYNVYEYLAGIDKENTTSETRKWFLEELKEKANEELKKRHNKLYNKNNSN